MSYRVLVTSFFEKKLKNFARRYRRIQQDFKDLILGMENNPLSGDRIRGCLGPVFKTRMGSRDMQRGKSGSFRVIYLVRENGKVVYLLTLYPKAERETIDAAEINGILVKTGLNQ